MGVHVDGKLVSAPWNDDFDRFLMRVGDTTHKFSGDELLHAIHREAIEAKWINLRLHAMVRTRLAVVIALLLTIAIMLLVKR